MISGVYSLTQQAIQLGFTPRMRIIHTSEQAKGQIYMPTVNWLVMLACSSWCAMFKESTRLASAYGFAVTATMTTDHVFSRHPFPLELAAVAERRPGGSVSGV